MIEPTTKRAVAFVDGQNLYHAARKAFGYSYPNYDVHALASAVCRTKGCGLAQVRFYTGLADSSRDPFWYNFWTAKLAVMGRQGVKVFTRSVRYRRRIVRLPDGTEQDIPVAEEKGIDVRISLDVILMALRNEYDVGVIFS